MQQVKIIAEIGCNHKGDMAVAREMILTAALFCKAAVVKFQKRTVKELLSFEEYYTPHPCRHNAFGKTYGEHREFLEFSLEQHRQLKNICEELGVEYSSSVWDIQAARDIMSLEPAMIKIPSACNLNFELLRFICAEYSGEIHLSLGMTTKDEIETIVSFFENHGRNDDLVLYSCTSAYPVSFDDIALLEIEMLKEKYFSRVKAVGFSGHHLGIAVDIAAFCLGAEYIERHFTLDRTWKGTDHAASLEPEGLRKLVRDIKAVASSMKRKEKDILDIEHVQRLKLKQTQIRWELSQHSYR